MDTAYSREVNKMGNTIIFDDEAMQIVAQNPDMWSKLGEVLYFVLQAKREKLLSPEMQINTTNLIPCELIEGNLAKAARLDEEGHE